jgi:hypothetical protein
MALSMGDTRSSVTPMGIHYESLVRRIPTSAERAFLADAAQSPPIPTTSSKLHVEPFTVELYPSGAPSPADVNQHAIGNCSAAAVFASLAYQSPSFVTGLIDDHGDGTFGVHVFDPAGRPLVINVDSTFLANSRNQIAAMSGKDDVADWATVLEKAVMKYLVVFPVVDSIGGIGSEFVSPMFTGSGASFGFMPGRLSPSNVERVVRSTLGSGKIVIGGFKDVLPLGDVNTVRLHAYTILVPPGAYMLSMRNPWGANRRVTGGLDGARDGVVDVPSLTSWSSLVDLRIIDPGAAQGAGRTTPYTPPVDAPVTTLPPRVDVEE